MAKDHEFDGERCRWYMNGSFYVSECGTKAYIAPKKGMTKSVPIEHDGKGKYIVIQRYNDRYKISIEKAVITCFCPPKPDDGQRYMIHHKDGNPDNCHYKNLEWKPYSYQHNSNPVIFICENKEIALTPDGTAKNGNVVEGVGYCCFDPDTNLTFSKAPFIRPSRRDFNLEKMMIEAGFIQGDDSTLTNPVILHIDNDWKNISGNNLIWVERSDPRYVDYHKKMVDDMNAETVAHNPGINIPESFLLKT